MEIKKIYASSVAKLTSNVYTGGGDDDTAAIQGVLDLAKDDNVGVHLIMDGAAFVEQLVLYSNTTIECMNKDCGFYQKGGMNCALITNANWNDYELETKNISLLGGTYHQNGQNQEHDNPNMPKRFICPDKVSTEEDVSKSPVITIEFYGVENLLVRDVTLRDFRTFALAVGCFKNVTIENTWLDLPYGTRGNQDGFHFWGPGQFLNVLHCGGKVGDDIINVGPDERDKISSITDVLIDGIFLDDGEQAVRLLSRGTGRLDRVTIRNISGVYRSYGFYINPWFVDDTCGNFGHILIENVDLKSVQKTYSAPPFLFSVGGNIECLTLKNIRHHAAHDNRPILDIGWPFYLPNYENYRMFAEDTPYQYYRHKQRLQNIIVDGLTIVEHEDEPKDTNYISVYDKVENMIIKNVTVIKNQEENGNLLYFEDHGEVENLVMEGIHTKGLKNIISDETKVKNRF